MTCKLKLEFFEGPLDLLLYLIKKDDIDIYDIPICEITDQYLEYIEMMKMLDLEIVGEFLVMAATLLQIKSRTLLPRDPQPEEPAEDPRDELVRRLEEYKVFKEVAEDLRGREGERQKLFARKIDDGARKDLTDDAKEVYFEANLFDLINAFTQAMNKFKSQPVYEVVKEEWTVEQKIHDILHLLLQENQVVLSELFSEARSKVEVVVSFIAVLELIRLKEIKFMQKRLFSDIVLIRNRENLVPDDKEPEPEPEGAGEESAPEAEAKDSEPEPTTEPEPKAEGKEA